MSARSKIVRDFSGQEVAIPYDPRDDAQHTPGPIDWSTVKAPRAIAATWSDNPRDLVAAAAWAEIVRRWEAHEVMLEALRELTESLVNALNRITMLDGGITDENEELVRWGEARIEQARAALAAAEGPGDTQS